MREDRGSSSLHLCCSRHEKENKTFLVEIEELKNEVESLARSKSQAVSLSKELESKLLEMNGKIDDAIRQLTDANNAKSRLVEENLTFSRRIESFEFELTSIQTIYKRTQGDLDEARLHLESEMAVSSRPLSPQVLATRPCVLSRPTERYNRR